MDDDARAEIKVLERNRLASELQQLQRRGSHWHSHKALFLYVAGAMALLLSGMREKDDQADWKRQRELEERITRRP